MANTETEWSTREKLAIASYVLRSGEQHWSGVGRLLRPLGEPGRSADWFSPKYCAQQYSALVEAVDVPKRKRSSERTDGNDNVQATVPTEEAIVSRLTKERIEELKKLVRCERSKFRKMQQEMFLVQSGALDDKLDEILQRMQEEEDVDKSQTGTNASVAETPAPSTSKDQEQTSETPNIEQLAQTAAQEIREEIERLNNSFAQEMADSPPTIHLVPPRDPTPVEKMEIAENTDDITMPAAYEAKPQQPEATPSSQPESTNTTEPENMEQEASETQNETMNRPHVDVLSKSANPPESDRVLPSIEPAVLSEGVHFAAFEAPVPPIHAENMVAPANDDAPRPEKVTVAESEKEYTPTQPSTNNKALVSVDNEPEQGLESRKVTNNLSLRIGTEDLSKQQPTSDDPKVITPEVGEPFHYAGEDIHEYHQSISLPGTPALSGSFTCDSFPSSPALSHSSDTDPDATASWKAWRKSIMILWKQVASHRFASLFLQPVTDDIAPNYSTTVYRSVDLSSLKKNIESGVTRTTADFQRDLMLMFQNAIMYNYREHDVYKMTTEMQSDVMDQVAQFLATQIMVETAHPSTNKSLRRSTIRRAAMGEKVNEVRSKRAAAVESEAKFSRKKPPPHEP